MNPALIPFFKPTQHHDNTFVLAFVGDSLVLLPEMTFPNLEALRILGDPLHIYDIAHSEQHTFSLHLWHESVEIPAPFQKTHLRSVLNSLPSHLFDPLIRAKQLVHWIQDNQYCGRCATPLNYDPLMSSLKCPQCGHMTFPKLSPACIVLITRGDEILLARSPNFAKGVYSLVAGFVEAGESAEECAKREVMEEVGVKIENLQYFGTQPWPFPHSFMIGFFAEYKSGEICIQEEEIEDAKWFTKDDLPVRPFNTSIASLMIQAWLDKK